ncbi:MAG: 23S rRNA (adenine(2503)-C(2))-methyltransferase RlmN, partial [Arcobacteraceae bacterium]|nr:23S rRNA (adenine(2503)-C(2))-methyltransferase RlmN [Arcobacteraceae bacterium]
MKNIPKELKITLEKDIPIDIGKIVKTEKSVDGSIKYLFEFKGGHTVEAVLLLMKEEEKNDEGNITQGAQYTFCVSSQVGCKVGCSFCLTAKGGFTRDLSAGEIVAQVSYLKKLNNIDEKKSVNIV